MDSPRFILLISSIMPIVILTSLSLAFARFAPFFRTKKGLLSFSFPLLNALKLLRVIGFFFLLLKLVDGSAIFVVVVVLLVDGTVKDLEQSPTLLESLVTAASPQGMNHFQGMNHNDDKTY